jgi:DHA2 family multidrug resistance protein
MLLAINTWNLAHITLDTSYDTIRLLLILRGAALGCTMQSSQLVALNSVPARFLTNASSLNTALRNVFQSFGVGILGVLVQTQTLAHVSMLSQQVTATSPAGATLQQAAAGLMRSAPGISESAARARAGMIMMGEVHRQAAVLAFGDAYRFTFFAALIAIVLSLFLPGRVRRSPEAAAEGDEVMLPVH